MGFDVPKMVAQPPLLASQSLVPPLALIGAGWTAHASHPIFLNGLAPKSAIPAPAWHVPSAFRSLFSSLALISAGPTPSPGLKAQVRLTGNSPSVAVSLGGERFKQGAAAIFPAPVTRVQNLGDDATDFASPSSQLAPGVSSASQHFSKVTSESNPAPAAAPFPLFHFETAEPAPIPAEPAGAAGALTFANGVFTSVETAPSRTPELPAAASRDLHVLNVLDTPAETVFLNSAQLAALTSFAEDVAPVSALLRLAGSVFYPAAALHALALRVEATLAEIPLRAETSQALQNKLVVLRTSLALLKPGTQVSARDASALFSFAAVPFADAREAASFQEILSDATASLNPMLREPALVRHALLNGFVDLRAAPNLAEGFESEGEGRAEAAVRVAATSQTNADAQGGGESGQEQQST